MRYLLLIAIACISTAILNAQDSHYWTNQYGTQSWLLGGAVVGSTTDLSSTYYNPGAVAFNPDTSSVQSAITLNVTRSSISTTEFDFRLRSGSSEPLPSLVAIKIPISFLGSQSLVVSYLKRTNVSLDLDGTSTSRTSDVAAYSVSGTVIRDLSDSWFGCTWSRKFDSVHSIGITAYGSVVRSQYSSLISLASFDATRTESGSLTEFEAYGTGRILAKLGYLYNGRPFSVGISVTTPALHILTLRGETRIAQALQENDSMITLYGDRQSTLTAEYRTPMSVALGATWHGATTSLYITMEWFAGLNPYRPLTPKTFRGIIPDTVYSYGEVVNSYPVVNVAIGMRTKITDRTSFYVSLIRDGSFLRSDETASNAIVNYDLYHGTVGWNFAIDPIEFTVGGIIGGGYVNSAPPTEYNDYVNLPPGTRVNRQLLRIGAILGIVAKL